jgi:O-antigen ligase
MALGLDLYPVLCRVVVCLCAGGLLATQSRGAYVAFLAACAFVPWRRYALYFVPLVAGVTLGVVAIVSSPDVGHVPWLGVVLVAAVVVAAVVHRELLPARLLGPRRVVAWVLLGALMVGALALLHHEIGLRVLAPSDQDRSVEWSTAVHQWFSAPAFGVGPDRLLLFHAVDGTYARFVHNEYLQILADSGLVGFALLGLSAVAVMRVARRFDVLSSCATAALVTLAVGGIFDFDWHLAFVGLLGGWCAGLARLGEEHGEGPGEGGGRRRDVGGVVRGFVPDDRRVARATTRRG